MTKERPSISLLSQKSLFRTRSSKLVSTSTQMASRSFQPYLPSHHNQPVWRSRTLIHYKYMFGNLFGFKEGKTPEEAEHLVRKVAERELGDGVNGPAIYRAFEVAREENEEKGLGLTNNHLLNITKDAALGMSSVIEDTLLGGPDQTSENINAEIDRLREGLTEEERKS